MTEAKKLSSYFHFTEPVNLKNKTLLEKADLDPSTDFLDSLEHDIPQGKGGRIKRYNEREGSPSSLGNAEVTRCVLLWHWCAWEKFLQIKGTLSFNVVSVVLNSLFKQL